MSYTTQAAIEAEIGLPDLIACTDDSQTGQLNSAVLNQLIANVSTYIDGRVANIYTVPFNPVPTVVASMALSICCYRLYRRRLTPDEKNNYYDEWVESKKFLDQVNKGEAHIDLTQGRNFPQGALVGRSTAFGGMGSNFPSNSL